MLIMINIPEELEEEFIVINDIKGMTIQEVINSMIQDYIEDNQELLETKEAKKLFFEEEN